MRPDELHQAFNFQYLGTDWDAAALREVIDASLDAMRPVGAPATWVLSNHDVTRHATRFANPPAGTQIREAGDRALGLRRARAATLLMLALPGSAYVYQGEELGLPDVTDLPDEVRQDPAFFRGDGPGRLPRRLPGADPVDRARARSYGFGAGGSWLPQPDGWGELSVEAQTGDPDSTLELYRTRARGCAASTPALGAGDAVEWLDGARGRPRLPARAASSAPSTRRARPVRIPRARPRAAGQRRRRTADGDVELPADTAVWWTV